MKWYKKAQKTMLGYKAVGYDPKTNSAYSFWGGKNFPIDLNIGSWITDPKGIYLGSSENFVLDYYSGMTDGEELLLTYKFNIEDAINIPDTSSCSGEIKVKRAQLIDIKQINKDKSGQIVEDISPWENNNELV